MTPEKNHGCSNHHQFNNHLKLILQLLIYEKRSNHHQFNNHLKLYTSSQNKLRCSNHHQFNNHLKPIFYNLNLII